jgi:hypothetical protein
MTDLFFTGLQQEKLHNLKLETWNKMQAELHQSLGENERMFVRRMYAKLLQQHYQEKYVDKGENDENASLLQLKINMLTTPSIQLSLKVIPEQIVAYLQKERLDLIRKFLRTGKLYDLRLLEEYPKETFHSELMEVTSHYRKLRHLPAINSQNPHSLLLKDFGCYILRQDGRPVMREEQEQISTGLAEIWSVLGNFQEVCVKNGLCIAHASGQPIYHSSQSTLGIYSPVRRMIVVGRGNSSADSPIIGLAHEFAGHWLDYISAPPMHWLKHLLGEILLLSRESVSASFVDAWIRRDESLISKAVWCMNRYNRVNFYMENDLLLPSEIWARLMEQYIAWRLHRKKKIKTISVSSLEKYYKTDGYWDAEDWKELCPRVEKQMQAQTWMARKVSGLSSSNRKFAPPSYREVFPWADSSNCWLTILEGKGFYE